MNFNFKNKNLTIILLLILILGSIFCYNVMHKSIENFTGCIDDSLLIYDHIVLGNDNINNQYFKINNISDISGLLSEIVMNDDPDGVLRSNSYEKIINASKNIFVNYDSSDNEILNEVAIFNNPSDLLTLNLDMSSNPDLSNNICIVFDVSSDNQTLLDLSGMPFTNLTINVDSETVIEKGKLKCKVTPVTSDNNDSKITQVIFRINTTQNLTDSTGSSYKDKFLDYLTSQGINNLTTSNFNININSDSTSNNIITTITTTSEDAVKTLSESDEFGRWIAMVVEI